MKLTSDELGGGPSVVVTTKFTVAFETAVMEEKVVLDVSAMCHLRFTHEYH